MEKDRYVFHAELIVHCVSWPVGDVGRRNVEKQKARKQRSMEKVRDDLDSQKRRVFAEKKRKRPHW
jgi:hypothetical protein